MPTGRGGRCAVRSEEGGDTGARDEEGVRRTGRAVRMARGSSREVGWMVVV